MRITVLGGDGYCGWATALYLSKKGHSVSVVDNFARRQWDHELGVQTLTPIRTLTDRLRVWRDLTGLDIDAFTGDVTDYDAKHSKLLDLGLQPHFLSESLLDSLVNIAVHYRDRIDKEQFMPRVDGRRTHNDRRRAALQSTK